MLERSAEVRFQGQWGGNSQAGEIGLGRLEGGGSSAWVGETQYRKHVNSLPQLPRASLLLASLTFSQEALRLAIIALEAGNNM